MSSPVTHDPRVSYEAFTHAAPAVYSALLALGKAVDASGLEKSLTELIKIRASQINGCAFCLQYHLTLARSQGVAPEKLDLVAAWHDAGVFTAREMAALAWTEALTRLASPGEAGAVGTDAVYARLLTQFTETEAQFLTVAIGAINQWNRIGVGLRFAPVLPGAGRTA
ncbi:MAG: carboxymuconolactone decarboxylase family protein [Telmatospirillum sp.]|nr:carboxymuconolactone decarboxylase family protein [Telmatospirillum sp.]